jgi:hypothetical protein
VWLWGPSRIVFGGQRGSLPWEKRPGRDADHSSASITELNNEWSHTTAFPIHLLGGDTEKLTFTFPLSVGLRGDL